MAANIPVIDIGPYLKGDEREAQRIVRSVGRACEELGFLVVSGHGVSEELLDDMRRVSKAFFDLPAEEKLAVRAIPGKSLGYVPLKTEYLAATQGHRTPPDLKESFDIPRPDRPDTEYFTCELGQYFFRRYSWPEHPEDFVDVWRRYYVELGSLSRSIMQMFAEALGLPHNYFESKLDKSVDFLRAINYPAQAEAPEPGQLRAGEHTDYGTLTLLAVEDVDGGLQVKSRDGNWLDVPAIPGTFVVNIGDMMAHWTNGKWVSTLHRVVNPSIDAGASARRLSVVFFQNPNYDTVIEPLPGCESVDVPTPISAGAWLRNKSVIAKVAG